MNQKKPLLQVALDTFSIEEAILAVKRIEPYVDIIEVGTILINAVGQTAIGILKQAFPNKKVVADMKIADAGAIFGKMAFDQHADLVTVICAAEIPTVASVVAEAQKYSHQPEVQIELTSKFNEQDLTAWKQAGATHVIYHRSRDAQAAGVLFSETDKQWLQKLKAAGFVVSVTGGIEVKDIAFFQGCPIDINPLKLPKKMFTSAIPL